MKKNEDLIKRIDQRAVETWNSEFSTESQEALFKETAAYADLNIPCPFLSDSICSIYEVRPRACASIFVTTPAEWCNPSNPNSEKVKPDVDLSVSLIDWPFYYKDIPVFFYMLHMPDIVYGILVNSVVYLSRFPGLEDLARDFMSDPEASAVYRRFQRHVEGN